MEPTRENRSKMLVSHNATSPVAEAFRTLKTNIQFSSIDKDIQTLLITSAQPSEGKSLTTCNLGLTLARSGVSVLLVDGDLRKPTMHKYFNLSNLMGLTNLLIDDELDLGHVANNIMDNLTVMTSGPIPPNPTELLQTKKMRHLLRQLKEQFDMIIIDSPPVMAVADASVLSILVDGTIMVVGHGVSSKASVLKAKEQLQMVKANILGVVMNKVPLNGQGYYYYYYYGGDKSKREKKTGIINRFLGRFSGKKR
ncbi:CpsD/CapB family tyrosine-protein kinase [Candidatus Contubernalis alkalaceticus]|nr:CpsD/CapB family tyrosine-protein kinase [Candidatus Contubernalis alkalaceticus]